MLNSLMVRVMRVITEYCQKEIFGFQSHWFVNVLSNVDFPISAMDSIIICISVSSV